MVRFRAIVLGSSGSVVPWYREADSTPADRARSTREPTPGDSTPPAKLHDHSEAAQRAAAGRRLAQGGAGGASSSTLAEPVALRYSAAPRPDGYPALPRTYSWADPYPADLRTPKPKSGPAPRAPNPPPTPGVTPAPTDLGAVVSPGRTPLSEAGLATQCLLCRLTSPSSAAKRPCPNALSKGGIERVRERVPPRCDRLHRATVDRAHAKQPRATLSHTGIG